MEPSRRPAVRVLMTSILVLSSVVLFLYISYAEFRFPAQLRGTILSAAIDTGLGRTSHSTEIQTATEANGSAGLDNQNTEIRVPAEKNVDSPRILLVVAYLRSGSSFTASLFTKQRDHFYVFEPLHQLMSRARQSRPLRYINGSTRRLQLGRGLGDNAVLEAMDNWFSCRLRQLDVTTLKDEFHTSRETGMRTYAQCERSNEQRLYIKPEHATVQAEYIAINKCIHLGENSCLSANLRVFKTIRLKMSVTEKLLMKYPNLMVIHLVRDPRGMFNSQYKARLLHGSVNSTVSERVKECCKRISKDVDITKRLLQSYSSRVKLLRYEDLAENPFEMLEDLYKFVGLKLTRDIMSYVKSSTSLNLPDGCVYCTRRGNSSRTALKWREVIQASLLNVVDQHCGEVYDKLGYARLNDVGDIRNTSLPTKL